MRYPTQDPKYDIEVTASGARLVNSATGKPIPADCPIFIFLAKDKRAVPALCNYRNACENDDHAVAVDTRIEEFEQYANTHSGDMKEPDTASRA